jgi:glycosyltransferase involved in cell wall biosynthesis
MSRKKILWLCSWYPSKLEPFNGDFIQRHAKAASLFNDIHVVHVVADTKKRRGKEAKELYQTPGLTEQILYFKKSNSIIGRIRGHYRTIGLYKRAFLDYVRANGKPDHIHVHIPMKAGVAAILITTDYKIRYLLTEHWGIYNEVADLNYTTRSRYFKMLTRRIFKESSRFISVSRYLGEGVNRMVLKKDYDVIPNVADTEKFFYNEQSVSKAFRFIHVSNMVKLKNADGILRSFKNLLTSKPDAELVMVGDTNDLLHKYAIELAIPKSNIIFKGEIPYADVAKEMQQANAFILFSNIENSPCVIGESLCCGLPVIASRVGGVPELLDESNSILVNAGDEKELTNAMVQMIDCYSSFDRMDIAEKAKNKFSYEVVGGQLGYLYNTTNNHY